MTVLLMFRIMLMSAAYCILVLLRYTCTVYVGDSGTFIKFTLSLTMVTAAV